MKQVPFKCRFGHVTIRIFSYSSPSLGTVSCDECRKWAGEYIFSVSKAHKNTKIVRDNLGIARSNEPAVRF